MTYRHYFLVMPIVNRLTSLERQCDMIIDLMTNMLSATLNYFQIETNPSHDSRMIFVTFLLYAYIINKQLTSDFVVSL